MCDDHKGEPRDHSGCSLALWLRGTEDCSVLSSLEADAAMWLAQFAVSCAIRALHQGAL